MNDDEKTKTLLPCPSGWSARYYSKQGPSDRDIIESREAGDHNNFGWTLHQRPGESSGDLIARWNNRKPIIGESA